MFNVDTLNATEPEWQPLDPCQNRRYAFAPRLSEKCSSNCARPPLKPAAPPSTTACRRRLTRIPRALIRLRHRLSPSRLDTVTRFRRYQRWQSLGGGVLITVAVLLTFALEAKTTAEKYLEYVRQSFVAEHAVLMKEIYTRENAFRISRQARS